MNYFFFYLFKIKWFYLSLLLLPIPEYFWNDLNKRNKGNNPFYFSEMLTYMDKVVGRIIEGKTNMIFLEVCLYTKWN